MNLHVNHHVANNQNFTNQINEMGRGSINLHTRMLTCIVVDFLLMLCDKNCTTLTVEQQSNPAATVTTTTLSQLDESAEQLQVAAPSSSCSIPGDICSTYRNLTCVCLQEWLRKFQRFEDNCSRYMPLLNSCCQQPAQNVVPVDSTAKAIDIINQQLRQETQKLKGIVVGKKVHFHL